MSERFGPSARLVVAIDRALDQARSKMTPWELKFLTDLSNLSRQKTALSVNQKAAARNALKRLGMPATA